MKKSRSSSLFSAPNLRKTGILAVDGIAGRNGHVGNRTRRSRVLGGRTATFLVATLGRISADNQEIGACSEALMTGSGRQNRDISGADLEDSALIAAETHTRRTARNAKNFVGAGVIVQVVVYAVSPGLVPVVAMKQVFEHGGGVLVW